MKIRGVQSKDLQSFHHQTKLKTSLDLPFFSLFIIGVSQGREPAESQLYAEHDRGPNRVGPVVLRVPASRPTANLQIIFNGTVEARKHWSEDVHWCMCVRMYVYGVCVKAVGGRLKECLLLHLQLWSPPPHHLSEEKAPELNWNQTMWRTLRGRRVTKNRFWCSFGTFWAAEAMRRKRKKKKKKQETHDHDYICQWLNESVFILIEQCYLAEVSFRYSPGKRMCDVFLFKKHSRLY